MKLYPSYVVGARMRHRQRVAFGAAGVAALAVLGAVALVVLDERTGLAAGELSLGCASGARSPAPACDRASLRPAG